MFDFSTKELKVTELPTDNKQFVLDADSLVEAVTSWKKSKTYNYKLATGEKQEVKTYYTTIKGEYWMARHSVIDGTKHPWDKIMHYYLGAVKGEDGEWAVKDKHGHTEYEIDYTKVLSEWGKLPLEAYEGYGSISNKDHLSKWASTWTHYELGAPLTTREFNEFILIAEPGFVNKSAYVIQLVASHPSDSSHVHGVYCSIDRYKQLDDGSIEWIMCTASDSGGNVPKWLQNSMIAKNVAHDVPMFLDWLAEKPHV